MKKVLEKKLVFIPAIIFVILCFPIVSLAVLLPDCAQNTVQTAINNASENNILTCPAGSWTWGSDLIINGKAITLQGAPNFATQIMVNWDGAAPVQIVTSGTKFVRLSQFQFIMGTDTGSGFGNVIHVSGGGTKFRIDNVKLDPIKRRGIVAANVKGVIDHCVFNSASTGTPQGVSFFGSPATGGDDAQPGGWEWTQGTYLGTENATYIEDSVFTWHTNGDSPIDSYQGARFVFRHNTVNSIGGTGGHGTDSGGYHSTHSYEIYNNTFSDPYGVNPWTAINLRGGTGVIYNNTVAASYGKFAVLHNYRSCTANTSVDVAAWGWCDGANGRDENSNAYGYACRDQIGTTGPRIGNAQVHQPLYLWNNTRGGSLGTAVNYNTCENETQVIRLNRDWYDNTVMPGYAPYTYPHPLTTSDQTKIPKYPGQIGVIN